ncbi:MAG: M15 family metallopeptidase [Candidatus Saccharimonadales bacterium]
MNLEGKLQRSKSTECINFSKYQPSNVSDPLVKISSTSGMIVEPYWALIDNWEGKRYADYISKHPEYDGIYVRSKLANRLKLAADSLGDDYRLVVRAGHRPIEVQRALLAECAEDYKNENPEASQKEALEHARTFVSDPDIKLAPHVCGAAVDIELADTVSGKLLDFGNRINKDENESFLHYPNLTNLQKHNREILLTTMLGAGFASCMPEWWHYSYGDQTWAWFYGQQHSLYSPIDL